MKGTEDKKDESICDIDKEKYPAAAKLAAKEAIKIVKKARANAKKKSVYKGIKRLVFPDALPELEDWITLVADLIDERLKELK